MKIRDIIKFNKEDLKLHLRLLKAKKSRDSKEKRQPTTWSDGIGDNAIRSMIDRQGPI